MPSDYFGVLKKTGFSVLCTLCIAPSLVLADCNTEDDDQSEYCDNGGRSVGKLPKNGTERWWKGAPDRSKMRTGIPKDPKTKKATRPAKIKSGKNRQILKAGKPVKADNIGSIKTGTRASTRRKKKLQTGVLPTRIFAGPDQFPPTGFAAYGILAFRNLATPATRDRHMMICSAYVAALPTAAALSRPHSEQMVTVWPINKNLVAQSLNSVYNMKELCTGAIDNYGLLTAQSAIRDVGDVPQISSRNGPFLFAWSPASDKGKSNVPVLIEDLSDVTTHAEALRVMTNWAREIEEKPERWREGFSAADIRVTIRRLADKYGQKIWLAVTGKP